MARWKLMVSHYLNVPDNEWEYNETERATGKPVRRRFTVPRLLDINDPTCWTSRFGPRGDENGEIIVCHEGKGNPGDQVFFGDPSPDMLPIDEEATEISGKLSARWGMRPEDGAGQYSQSLVDSMQTEMAKTQAKASADMSDLAAAIKQLAESNSQIINNMTRRV